MSFENFLTFLQSLMIDEWKNDGKVKVKKQSFFLILIALLVAQKKNIALLTHALV